MYISPATCINTKLHIRVLDAGVAEDSAAEIRQAIGPQACWILSSNLFVTLLFPVKQKLYRMSILAAYR